MKGEEIINNWKDQRSQIEVKEDFAQDVMRQIYQYEQRKRRPLFDIQWFFEFVSTNPLAKLALVTAGVIAGFIRMAFTVYVFLGT